MKTKKTTEATPAKSNAAQRVQALENMLLMQDQQIKALANEILDVRETTTALARRLSATVRAAETGTVTNSSVNQILIEENVKDLENKVKFLVEQQVMVKSETGEVVPTGFVVARELNQETNEVVNPRIQFAMGSLAPEMIEKFSGKKVGDVVRYDDTAPALEIVESYVVNSTPVNQTFTGETTEGV